MMKRRKDPMAHKVPHKLAIVFLVAGICAPIPFVVMYYTGDFEVIQNPYIRFAIQLTLFFVVIGVAGAVGGYGAALVDLMSDPEDKE